MKRNNLTYRIVAITMAVLMLTTSVGFSMDIHYCQGKIKSASLFGKAKNCYELASLAKVKSCTQHQKMMRNDGEPSLSKKDCCENKTFHFQNNLTKEGPVVDQLLSQPLQQFIAAYVAVFIHPIITDHEAVAFAHYQPPLIVRDIYALSETFLI